MTSPSEDDLQQTLAGYAERLAPFQAKPEPFAPGEPLFWEDPHISTQMLATHLDPTTDLASRKPETIDASVAWIVDILGLQAGDSVLDLGCGPGLYAARLARRGLKVTGVDYSRRSIAFARDFARQQGLPIDYRCQDYRPLTDQDRYAAALLIFGDYCTSSLAQRQKLLEIVHRALHEGGHFVLDVSTRVSRAKWGNQNSAYASQGGFWRPGPHLVIEQGFDYPADAIWLDQYIVIDEDDSITVYRNWFQDFEPETIQAELTAGGFEVQHLMGDLTGVPYREGSEWIGLVAQRTTP